MPDAFRVGFLSLRKVGQIMTRTIVTVPASASLARLRRTADAHPDEQWFIVTEGGFVAGVDSRADIPVSTSDGKYRRGFATRILQPYSVGTEEEVAFDVASRMRAEGTFVALIAASSRSPLRFADVRGVLGRDHLGDVVDEYVDFYSGRQR